MKLRNKLAAGALALAAPLAFAACDQAAPSPNGVNWVFTPDVALHRSSGKSMIRFHGLCSNGTSLWVSYTGWANADLMTQGQTMVAGCSSYGGHAVGGDNWGIEDHPS